MNSEESVKRIWRVTRFIAELSPCYMTPLTPVSQPQVGRWHDSERIGTVLAEREKLSMPFTAPQCDPLSLLDPLWTTGAILSRILWWVTEKSPPLDVICSVTPAPGHTSGGGS